VEGLLEAPMTRGGENGTMVTMSPVGTAIERENLQAFQLVHSFEQGHVRRQSSRRQPVLPEQAKIARMHAKSGVIREAQFNTFSLVETIL
jgi:hypothetical protein